MLADGVALDPHGGTADDYAMLVTDDPDVAKKYGMEEESEFLGFDGPHDLGQDPNQKKAWEIFRVRSAAAWKAPL